MTVVTLSRTLSLLISRTVIVILAFPIIATAVSSGATGSDTPPSAQATRTCENPQHHQFDFWIGEWQVFDTATGKLVGFSRIEKQLKGCALVQNIVWLADDEWRRSDLDYRLSGIGVSVVQGDRWSMFWADNYGGSTVVEGRQQRDGSMLFETPTDGAGKAVRGVWKPNDDGSVRNITYRSMDAKKTWTPFIDWLYRPNR